MFPKLYKYSTTNQLMSWQIFVENNTYYTEEGITKLTKSKPTVCTPKNVGRSNETTAEQQALLEAQSLHRKKLEKGYSENPQNLNLHSSFKEPMLAFKLEEYEKLLFTVPTFIQPKLDGIRCVLYNNKLKTRNGKDIVTCDHVIVNEHFDGELYNHDLKKDFNQIVSLVKKTKPTQEDIEEAKKAIEYWVYDLPSSNDPYSKRYEILKQKFDSGLLNNNLKLIPMYQVFTKEDIDRYHIQFLHEGYEGSMIRLDLGGYENKRSKQLLKYKNFKDEEFEVLDVLEGLGNRSGVAGKLVCKIGNETFECSMTGTLEYMEEVFVNKHKYIGKLATVKFFDYTPKGKPRFPVLKELNRID